MSTIVDSEGGSPMFGDDERVPASEDLRQRISERILDRASLLAGDAVALFRVSAEAANPDYSSPAATLLLQLLASAIREEKSDRHNGLVTDLRRLAVERGLAPDRLFTFAYLMERTVVDELALSASIGVSSEHWPVVAQIVRRASFDFLAAYAQRLDVEPADAAIVDRLTTVHTRPLLDAVLAKELERAGRRGAALSFILFDVDHLSTINERHGRGVGDRILERLGVLIRTYFRQHDWVSRHSDDSIAVFLTGTEAGHANDLAERVRATVSERLGFVDHRTGSSVVVTVTAAVLNAQVSMGGIIDADRLIADAETAVERGKRAGRNRVEIVDHYPVSRTLPRSSPSA